MLDRLLGLETEYAIRFSPELGVERPSHDLIFDCLVGAVERIVSVRPGERHAENGQVFTQNGGAFCYGTLHTKSLEKK